MARSLGSHYSSDDIANQIIESATGINLQDLADPGSNLSISIIGSGMKGSGPDDEDEPQMVSAEDGPIMGPAGVQAIPPSPFNLNAISLTKLGRNSLEDYQFAMDLIKRPDIELAIFLRTLRNFVEKSFLTPSHGNRMKDLLTELFHQYKSVPGMYAKYIIHLFLYVIDMKLGVDVTDVSEAEVNLNRHFSNYFGETVSIKTDQGFMAHVRLLVNMASNERTAIEPIRPREPYIEGSGQLESMEQGMQTLIRDTTNQQTEYNVLSRRRMHRPNHRGHTLFTPNASNRKTQERMGPFKAELDPDLRRPVTDFKSPRVIKTQTPRITTVKPSGAIGISMPQVVPGKLKYRTTYDRQGRVTGVSVPVMTVPNTYGKIQRQTITGSGVSTAHKTGGRRRGITLFGDDTNERRAQKRLRRTFTLALHNEK